MSHQYNCCTFNHRCKLHAQILSLANGFVVACGDFILLWQVGPAVKTIFPAHLLTRLATAPRFTLEKQKHICNILRTWAFGKNIFSLAKCGPYWSILFYLHPVRLWNCLFDGLGTQTAWSQCKVQVRSPCTLRLGRRTSNKGWYFGTPWKSMSPICSSPYVSNFRGILLSWLQYKTFENLTLVDSVDTGDDEIKSLTLGPAFPGRPSSPFSPRSPCREHKKSIHKLLWCLCSTFAANGEEYFNSASRDQLEGVNGVIWEYASWNVFPF